jgi:hypothetical protein
MRFIVLMAAVAVASCQRGPQPREAAADSVPSQSAGVVDSVQPMPVMLARFRADIPEVKTMTSGQPTRDALVKSIVHALATSDTAQLEKDAVNVREFAWLYFPTGINARPPYELPPGLAWFRLQEADRKGVFRALRNLGGHRLDYRGYTCDSKPTLEGPNKTWIHCLVTLGVDGEKPVPVKLFSGMLERDGHFAILSFQNDY